MGTTQDNGALPGWLTATVVMVLLGCFVFNLWRYGAEGYPMAMVIGGLLGAYGGAKQLVGRKSDREG